MARFGAPVRAVALRAIGALVFLTIVVEAAKKKEDKKEEDDEVSAGPLAALTFGNALVELAGHYAYQELIDYRVYFRFLLGFKLDEVLLGIVASIFYKGYCCDRSSNVSNASSAKRIGGTTWHTITVKNGRARNAASPPAKA